MNDPIPSFAGPLQSLEVYHPSLLWDHIAAATAANCAVTPNPHPITIQATNVPRFGSADVSISVNATGVAESAVRRIRKTVDSARLVEFAAVGIAALALHYLGNHEIIDVTARGSGADYLVDEDRNLLEVAGRSRRSDLPAAWNERLTRLQRGKLSFYLFVIEFETSSARLMFSEI
jgi:hypothetical protein